MDTKAQDAFSLARSSLLLDHFFFGRLAMFLTPRQDPKVRTLQVDGKSITYNPTFFMNLSPTLRKSAIAHEVMHCVLDHITRRKHRNPKKWNMAGDYVINLALEKDKLHIGQGWLLNPAYEGMSADEVYNLLPDMSDDAPDPSLCDVMEPDEDINQTDQAEIERMREEWKVNVGQAAYEAEQRGQMPAHLKRDVEDLLTNTVPWRVVMQEFFNERRRDDYSWVRPNRMFVAAGLYLPALHSEGMGPLDFVIDTSGSIDQEQLNEFAAECKAAVAALSPSRVRVIYADAAVNHVDEFAPGEEPVFNMHGGGGTDFRPALAFAAEDPPVALAYLTDMYGRFPNKDPGYPVLWVATTNLVGPFGRTVQMKG